ncbi:MAG: hypothetical protein GVY29_04630, partial [Spirochaetes bacterium]|nr:hypothetical protein [Spirochaetota bacterium]
MRLLFGIESASEELRADLVGFAASLRRRLELLEEVDVVDPHASDASGEGSPRDIGLVLGSAGGEMGYELRLASGATTGRRRLDLSRPAEARSAILGA